MSQNLDGHFYMDRGYAWCVLIFSVICNILFKSALSEALYLVNFIDAFDISTYHAGFLCSLRAFITALGGKCIKHYAFKNFSICHILCQYAYRYC